MDKKMEQKKQEQQGQEYEVSIVGEKSTFKTRVKITDAQFNRLVTMFLHKTNR